MPILQEQKSAIYAYINSLAACDFALPAQKIPARRRVKSFLVCLLFFTLAALETYSLGYLPDCKLPRCVRFRLAGRKNPGAQAD